MPQQTRPSRRRLRALAALVALGGCVGAAMPAAAQHAHPPAPRPAAPPVTAPATPTVTTTPPGAPRRVSEAEIHANTGTPRGWRFGVVPGDAVRGREMFVELECFKCHAVRNEKFPAPADGKYSGPELSGMGAMHPAEYLAESILFPNAVIVDEPGATGPDGLSVMPSYADSLTVIQWLDLVAYLKSLTQGGEHPAGHGVSRETVAGDYRIRVVYMDAGHGAHGAHGAHAGHGATAPAPARAGSTRAKGHLMVFITERETGDAVPYLPVMVILQGPGATRRTVSLRPMMSGDGFHYGADVVVSERTEKLSLVIGATNMRVAPSAKGRFTKPVTAVFDWGAAAR